MEILEVHKIEYYLITTDEEGWNTYRRNIHGGPDSWEISIGESWEYFYNSNELEKLFQYWLKTQLIYVHRFTKSDEDYGII